MMAFEEIRDEELVRRYRAGEAPVLDYLMEKYKGLVRQRARALYLIGGETDDLIQEGMIGLFKAIRDYDIGRDASFATFADLCISRQMYSAIKASARKKHAPLNSYISLYSEKTDSSTDNDVALEDVLESDSSSIPEEQIIERENLEALENAIERELSDLERQVLDLYITGMSIKEVSAVLGRDEKSTDNAMQRIKTKLKKYLRK